MTTKTYRFQESLNDRFTNSGQSIKEFVRNYEISNSDKYLLTENLKKDSKDFYFKGVFSLSSALKDISHRRYSWATVKIYYSIFYFLRSCLSINRVGMFRLKRDLYGLEIENGGKFAKVRESHTILKTDHKATIQLYQDKFGENVFNGFSLNKIEGKNCFKWVMTKRELVNYKNRAFTEPNCPKFWKEIDKRIEKGQFVPIVSEFFNDRSLIFTFQSESAILALPIQLFINAKSQLLLHLEEIYDVDNFRAIQSFEFDQSISKMILK